jgi:membrane-bound serine protease (ClpP class)
MAHPGLVVPGGVAAVALVALLAPPMLVGMAGWWEVGAIVGGILLIVIEIFILPGFGVAGILGIILILGGLLGTFVDNSGGGLFPDSPQGRQDLMYGAVSLLLSIVSSGVAIYFISKPRPCAPRRPCPSAAG